MRQLIIGDRVISDDSEAYVIAEIGHNHQGSLKTAKELFQAAAECGVAAAKLQKRDNRSLYTREMFDKPYDNENSFGATYGEHREALEFGKPEYEELQTRGRPARHRRSSRRRSTSRAPTSWPSSDAQAYKIASGDLKNTPLLQARREARQADDRQHRRRHDRGRAARLRRDHADQPAAVPAAVHLRLSGGVRRARPARDRDLSREVPGRRHRLLRSRQRHRDAAGRLHARRARHRKALHAEPRDEEAPTIASRSSRSA